MEAVTGQVVISVRIMGCNRYGQRAMRALSPEEHRKMVDHCPRLMLAWAYFNAHFGLGALTVFRRWLSIFYPHVTVWVYTR